MIKRIDKKPSEFKILDLFCGAGGLSWGMDKNPYFKTMVALDFDENAANTFKKNMPYAEVVVGDITDSKIKENIVSLAKKTGVNMIVGGPPCQGYSMKGKKLGLQDPRNFLFREYLDLVQRLQPDVFVIENVKGLLLSANGWFKDQIVSTIEKLGYTVRFGILNAANFGVPQPPMILQNHRPATFFHAIIYIGGSSSMKCIFCKQPTGFMRRYHSDCHHKTKIIIQQIETIINQYKDIDVVPRMPNSNSRNLPIPVHYIKTIWPLN